MNTATAAPERPRLARHGLALLLAVVFGLAAFLLYTRHNDFPEHYHWDESTKVSQAMDGSTPWNFNHPLLLLETGRLFWKVQQASVPHAPAADLQERRLNVAIAGRTASAALAAIGVAALALTGYLAQGFVGLLLTGLIVALCPPLLIYAHYFKEDPALVSGVMVAILGARLLFSAQRAWHQALAAAVLGLGCAMAVSGKYVGGVMLLPALLALGMAPALRPSQIAMRSLVFVVAVLTVTLFINQRAFDNWATLSLSPAAVSGFQREFAHGTSGHIDVTLGLGNARALRVAAGETLPHLWLLGSLGLAWVLVRQRITRWGIVVAGFIATWVVTLSMNTIPFDRYALPITVLVYFSVAQLTAFVVRDGGSRAGGLVLVLALGAVVVIQMPLVARLIHQFLDDSRQQLYAWVAENVPPGSTILAERMTSLVHNGDARRHPDQPAAEAGHRIQMVPRASAYRSATRIAVQGYDYVAVAGPTFERYYIPGVYDPGRADRVPEQRRFYDDLFARGELVWSYHPDPETHASHNPELRVYRISQLRPPAPRP